MPLNNLLNTVHHFSEGVYAKQMTLQPGWFAITHKHNYSHLSILAEGKVQVTVEGSAPIILRAPAVIEIKANLAHRIDALDYSTWFCIHATDVADPATVDNVLISKD